MPIMIGDAIGTEDKTKLQRYGQRKMFVDTAKIYIKSGDGGSGAVSFPREKPVPNGGPDGGDSGNGGDVVFVADPDMRTLLDFRYIRHYRAQNGQNGQGDMCKGKRGEDVIIKVPCGTIIKDGLSGRIMADMYKPGERKIILKGGQGGKGNARFTTPTRQAPNFSQTGEATKEISVLLEVKTIADVGLIGFPNVGKSTILSVITKARPKIANYHFTTLSPNLGVASYHGHSFVVADIPGLIEGASDGVGLGHDFLRHIERTRMLLHVLDISGSEGRDPVEDYRVINNELERYSEKLAALPQIIIANKSELPGSTENLERLKKAVDNEIIEVSAATAQGFDKLLGAVWKVLEKLPAPEPIRPQEMWQEQQENPDAFFVAKDGEAFVVTGPLISRLERSVILDDAESFSYFQRMLREKGVIKELVSSGAVQGSTVRIGDIEFDFVE